MTKSKMPVIAGKLFILVILLLVSLSAIPSRAENYAIHFDGVDDYIEVPHNSSFNWNQQATIECWVRIFNSNSGVIFNKWMYGYEDKEMWFNSQRMVSFYLYGLIYQPDVTYSRCIFNIDQWYHVTGTSNGDSFYIYINGYVDTSWAASGSSIGNSTNPAIIGAPYNRPGSVCISGEIDELRIWNVYKTPEEIRSMMFQEASGNEPGLVAVWHFNEGQGQTAFDVSPNHNDGRLGSSTGADPQDPQWVISTSPSNPDSIPFAPAVTYAAGAHPHHIFCADLDGDGDLDLAVANYRDHNVSILKNNGDGTFQSAVNYDVGYYPLSVFCADLDGDGDLDLAVANELSDNVSILKNNGDGTFQTKVDYGVGDGPYSVFCADLDGDSDLDLAVANGLSDNVSILKNNGDGTFQTKVDYGVGDGAVYVFCADLDGDGDLDIATANEGSDNVSILINNGNGTFQTKTDYVTGDRPVSVFCADLDGDLDLDLAVANYNTDNVSILKNNGNGTFQTKVDYGAGDSTFSVFCADLDGDNDLDLAIGNDGSDNVSILKNNGNGTFQTKTDYVTGDRPVSVFCADLDGDTDLDLAVVNYGSNTVSILKNLSNQPVPGTISGRIKDATTHEDLQDALVEALQEGIVKGSDITNSYGLYSIPNLSAGTYDIRASKPGYQTQTQTAKHVFAGQTTIVNFLLAPIPSTGSISGNVKDVFTQGNLQDVLVEAIQGAQTIGYDHTDANGDYEIPNLSPGSYDVRASKFGYETQTQTSVIVQTDQPTTVNFELMPLPTGMVSGLVYDGCTESGLGGVQIDFLQDDQVRYPTTTQSPDGNYNLWNVFTGTYMIRHSKEGYQTEYLEVNITPEWNIIPIVTIYPTGYVSSQPLKDALNEFCLAYKNYMTHMSDRIIDVENEVFTELYLPEYAPADTFADNIWTSFQQPTADGILAAVTINVDDFARRGHYPGLNDPCQSCLSAATLAKDVVFILLEDHCAGAYEEIYGYLLNQTIPGSELKDKNMVIIKDNPPVPGQSVYTINQILSYLDDWNVSQNIVKCLPADFPINNIVEKLNDLTNKIRNVTYPELSNFPDFYYDDAWTMDGYHSLNNDATYSFGLINHKMKDVREKLLGFAQANIFSRTFHDGCQLFGLGGTSYKTINLVHYGLNPGGPGWWKVLGKSLFWGGLACNSLAYISGVVTASREASLTETLTDFNLFWPDYYGRSFKFYRQVNQSLFDATNDPSLFSASTKYDCYSINVPTEICFSLDEFSRRIDGTVSIRNSDPIKPGKVMLVGAVYVYFIDHWETLNQFKSEITDISPGTIVSTPFYFTLPTPTFFNFFRDCIIDVDILTTCKTINLLKQIRVGVIPDCPGGPAPYVNVTNLSLQNIGQGQTISADFNASPTSKSAAFSMRFGGSDVDLHLYDRDSNHVGRNYETGQIELEIPAAQFLGDSTNSETIIIPTLPNASYRVEAFGVNLPDSEVVTLDAIETIQAELQLSTFPSPIFIDVLQGDSLDFIGSLFDYSGQNELTIDTAIFSSFVDSLGDTLSSSLVGISYPNLIPEDSMASYLIHVNIPYSQSVGLYLGSLTFTSASDSIRIPVSIEIIKSYTRGDANGDGVINVTDVVYLINYLFLIPPGPAPIPLEAGDVNCDGFVNVTDVVYLINYLFLVPPGPPPCE